MAVVVLPSSPEWQRRAEQAEAAREAGAAGAAGGVRDIVCVAPRRSARACSGPWSGRRFGGDSALNHRRESADDGWVARRRCCRLASPRSAQDTCVVRVAVATLKATHLPLLQHIWRKVVARPPPSVPRDAPPPLEGNTSPAGKQRRRSTPP